jgi:hypothetical protein
LLFLFLDLEVFLSSSIDSSLVGCGELEVCQHQLSPFQQDLRILFLSVATTNKEEITNMQLRSKKKKKRKEKKTALR